MNFLKKLFQTDNIANQTGKSLLSVSQIDQQKPLWSAKITPGEIATALSFARSGKLKHLLSLYANLYSLDDNLAGDTDVRVESIKSATWTLPENLSKKQTEFFNNFLDEFFPTLIDQATDLKLTGALFRQIIYRLENGLYTVDKFISYENLDLRNINGELVLYIDEVPQSLDDAKFIRFLQDYSVYESIVKYYAFFSFSLNNWASFIEIYGKPVRIGKYKPGSSTEEKNILKQMVKNLGTDLGAVISENTLIEFADFKNASANANLYSDLLDFCKKAVSKRILGQTLTTNTETTGSYAQAKVHDMVRQDILRADLRDCEKYVSWICTKLNNQNFNNDSIKIKLSTAQNVELSSRIDIDVKLNNIIEIDPEYWYQTYNIPIPKNGAKAKEIQTMQFPMWGKANNTPEPVESGYFQNGNNHSIIRKLKEIREKINNAKSYNEIKNIKYPVELYHAVASEMYQSVMNTYTEIRLDCKSNRNIQNKKYFEIDWTLEDIEALHAFRAETFIVAGVSSQTLIDMIKEEAEKAFTQGTTFDDFKRTLKLNGFEPENPYHLRTNFYQAINTARAAAEWKNYQTTKEIFPYLRYVTMEDEAVRDEHAGLHGIVRAIDDPFWQKYYPPNDWGCRCYVEPVAADEAAGDPNFNKMPPTDYQIKEEFQRNPGEDNSLFGSWLSCEDAKNIASFEQITARSIRLYIHNSGQRYCPQMYEKTNKDLNLKEWQDMKEHKLPDLFPTDGLSKEEMLKAYNEYLGDRTILDATNTPIKLKYDNKLVNPKYDKYNVARRVQHMYCIEDVIKAPDEIWQTDKKEGRAYYFKKYSNNVIIMADFVNGSLEYFNIFTARDSYINKQRKGFMIKA